MRENLKLILLVIFGLIIALTCVAWSLGGRWKLSERVKIPPTIPLSKKEVFPKLILTLDPKEKTVYQGEGFTIDLFIESEEELMAIDIFLSYNPQTLELTSIKPGKFFASPKEFSEEINQKEGKAFYALGSLTPTSGKGTLISLVFEGKTGGKQGMVLIEKQTLALVKGGKKIDIQLPDAGQYFILELAE